jgi:hypothetical protein
MARTWNNWNHISGDSEYAQRLGDDDDFRDGRERKPSEYVSRLGVHMTGRSIVARAIKRNENILEHILSYYTQKSTSSHYLLHWDGELWQMTDDRIRVPHIGVTASERALYLSGAWAKGAPDREGRVISAATVKLWRAAWPHYKSPQHLFPTDSVNNVSVGVEMPPCWVSGKYLAEPLRDGLWHTAAQHLGIALLACDLAKRHSWERNWWIDPKGGPRTPILPGHEDCDLYGRSQSTGGWDPGALRSSPRWDWDTVIHLIMMRQTYGELRRYLVMAADVVGRTATKLF